MSRFPPVAPADAAAYGLARLGAARRALRPIDRLVVRGEREAHGYVLGRSVAAVSRGQVEEPHGLVAQTRGLGPIGPLGEGATELIHIGQAVLNLNGPVEYFVENTFNYPTLAEAYKIAALDVWNRMPRAN